MFALITYSIRFFVHTFVCMSKFMAHAYVFRFCKYLAVKRDDDTNDDLSYGAATTTTTVTKWCIDDVTTSNQCVKCLTVLLLNQMSSICLSKWNSYTLRVCFFRPPIESKYFVHFNASVFNDLTFFISFSTPKRQQNEDKLQQQQKNL